jgi:hypothetical protein
MCARMKLRTFLKQATARERIQLAKGCSSSVAYLYQMAGQHRHASPQMATRIEQVSRQMAVKSRGRLGLVPRESLVRHPEIFAGLLTEVS